MLPRMPRSLFIRKSSTGLKLPRDFSLQSREMGFPRHVPAKEGGQEGGKEEPTGCKCQSEKARDGATGFRNEFAHGVLPDRCCRFPCQPPPGYGIRCPHPRLDDLARQNLANKPEGKNIYLTRI